MLSPNKRKSARHMPSLILWRLRLRFEASRGSVECSRLLLEDLPRCRHKDLFTLNSRLYESASHRAFVDTAGACTVICMSSLENGICTIALRFMFLISFLTYGLTTTTVVFRKIFGLIPS